MSNYLESIDRALIYWPNWEPAVSARREVIDFQEAREARLRKVGELVAARKLVEARAEYDHLERAYRDPGSARLEKAITDGLARATALEREGDTLRRAGQTEKALERYDQALAISADLTGPRDAIAAFPPPAPRKLTAAALRSGFRLRWEVAPFRGRVQYRVLRTAGNRPNHHEDGTVLGNVSDPELDDADVPVGKPIYYAVFAERSGVWSQESAAIGPLLLTADVSEAHIMSGDGTVALRWTAPPGISRVELWRQAGRSGIQRGQADRLSAGDDGAHDAGLRNGERYNYLVVAVFPDPSKPGGELFASGVALSAVPAPPPAAVRDLRVRRAGGNVLLSWTPVPGASVQIRMSRRMPDLTVGSVMPIRSVEQIGKLVEVRAPGNTEFRIEEPGRLIFVPLTTAGESAVIGEPAAVVTIDDVTNLCSKTNGREIMLTWDWPPGTEEVAVCYKNDAYSTRPDEPGITRARVTHGAYDRCHGFEVRALRRDRHYFTVFVIDATGHLYSAGARILEPMGQGTTVRYCVSLKKAGLLRRGVTEVWLDLQCDKPVCSLPALLLLGKDGRQPLSPSDGQLLVEIPELHFAEGRARIDIPKERTRPSTYVKLFFKDGRHAQEIRLMPGSAEELRLG